MVEQFEVQAVERKKTKAGKDYLVLTLGDRLVSFFEVADVAVDVQVGHTVTCEVVQKGKFWNGARLINVTMGVAAKAPAPATTPAPTGAKAAPAGQGGKTLIEGSGDRQNLYSARVDAGNQTYFIDVRVAKNSKNYLTITQTEAQGKQRVIVFADNIQKFSDALKPALDLFNKQK
jgi:hypothetical protein